ncbi:MAG TPA: DUF305 domain-containing protein [Aggregatilineales bacterium]|nr:DUF305 domain-containing protein [Anaerolineales bacterium]HRE48032.1 DUF305 domain-containing protein [Aggregatilineales bacterium]
MYRFLVRTLLLICLVFAAGALSVVHADSPTEGRAGRAEVRFLEGMIDHHQMALDMANDCLAKATSDAVKTLCQNIITAQTAEIETMQGWLLAWYAVAYQPISMMSMTDTSMMEMDHSGMGMPNSDPVMMMGMMAGLARLQGGDYEIAWLESMIDHHDDALHMATRILRQTEGSGHPELRALAEAILTDQTAEIALMEGLISDLAK